MAYFSLNEKCHAFCLKVCTYCELGPIIVHYELNCFDTLHGTLQTSRETWGPIPALHTFLQMDLGTLKSAEYNGENRGMGP